MDDIQETAGHRVYQNDLVFSEICKAIKRRSDLICLSVADKRCFVRAAGGIYEEVENHVLQTLADADCVFANLVTYISSVRHIHWVGLNFPIYINTNLLRQRFPRLRQISFRLPITPERSIITLYPPHEPTPNASPRIKPSLEGSMFLVVDSSRCTGLIHPSMCVSGPLRRYHLKGLQLGLRVRYTSEEGFNSGRHCPVEVMTTTDDDDDVRSNHAFEELFAGVETLYIGNAVSEGDVDRILSAMPNLKELSIFCRERNEWLQSVQRINRFQHSDIISISDDESEESGEMSDGAGDSSSEGSEDGEPEHEELVAPFGQPWYTYGDQYLDQDDHHDYYDAAEDSFDYASESENDESTRTGSEHSGSDHSGSDHSGSEHSSSRHSSSSSSSRSGSRSIIASSEEESPYILDQVGHPVLSSEVLPRIIARFPDMMRSLTSVTLASNHHGLRLSGYDTIWPQARSITLEWNLAELQDYTLEDLASRLASSSEQSDHLETFNPNNKLETLTLIMHRDVVSHNPLKAGQILCILTPARTVIDLQPQFFKPDRRFMDWVKHVHEARYSGLLMLQQRAEKGFRRREEENA